MEPGTLSPDIRQLRIGMIGAAGAYDDFRAMLAAEQLAAVIISLDPGDHCDVAAQCLSAGVDVFVEKALVQ
jgi:predicted dehydrogenase